MYSGKLLVLGIPVLLTATTVAQANPPDSFDLRGWYPCNYVTSVKSQQGGTCWAHGTMAAIESNLLMTSNWYLADTGEPNLAEYHLDWWNGFNQHHNDDIDPPDGEGLEVHMGGDYKVAAAYLTRGEGAVRDIDGQSFGSPPERYDSSYHIYYPRHVEFYSAGADLSNINTIKYMLMEHGAMGTCMSVEDYYFDYDNWTYYQPPNTTEPPVHAIAIVGWNDHKVTPAPEPGAWICKNSWGSGWGEGGFFWISYYDKWCGKHSSMGAVSFQDVHLKQWDKIYYHDYHGWRDEATDVDEAFNAFYSPGRDLLDAVGFVTAEDSVDFVVKVYDSFVDGELQNELTSVTGYVEHKGYHTVDLVPPLGLCPGDFYIYVTLSRGGHPYDCTSQIDLLLGARYRVVVKSSADFGQSYYRVNEEWLDFKYVNMTANFCIKGLCIGDAISMNPQPRLGWVPLDVTFDACTKLETDAWCWSFGDGDSSDVQCPCHTYDIRGCYDVTVQLDVDSVPVTFTQPNCVIALADTISALPSEAAPGYRAEVAVSVTNTIPLHTLRIPVEYEGSLASLTLDSMSTAGCRTEAFDLIEIIHWDALNKRYTVRLSAGSAPPLSADTGEVIRLFFGIPPDAVPGQTAQLTFDGYPGQQPLFVGELGEYEAACHVSTVTVTDECCRGIRGNVDADPSELVNVVDLTYLVAYLFGGGVAPLCPQEANLDADPGETVNIVDLTALVDYLFAEGDDPPACPR